MSLAVSSDMLVEGRHFVSTVAPERLGHKALAVNLSDLAACGARPLAFSLSLALPAADEAFLAPFARGLLALAERHDCELIGGDTTRGPLTISITAFGEIATGAALLRSGARAGDDLYVSGTLGDARLALEVLRGTVAVAGDAFARIRRAMEEPTAAGRARPGAASASPAARSMSPMAWPAISAMCCAAPASARWSRSTPCRAAPISPRQDRSAAARMPARRRRRLRADLHRRRRPARCGRRRRPAPRRRR